MAEAARLNQGKPPMSFVLQFPTAVEAFARVMEMGAVKYARDNWRLGGKPDHEYLDAAVRHLVAFMEGEFFAVDTGCAHLSHAAWNLFALHELNYRGVSRDKTIFEKQLKHWAEAMAEKEAAPPQPCGCKEEPKKRAHSYEDWR